MELEGLMSRGGRMREERKWMNRKKSVRNGGEKSGGVFRMKRAFFGWLCFVKESRKIDGKCHIIVESQ